MGGINSGRLPKPASLHKLDGTYRADRHGAAGDALEPDGVPERPTWLTGDAAELWDSLTPRLVACGVATSLDAETLAGLCRWWALWRHFDQQVDDRKSMLAASLAWRQFSTVAAKFGLSPAERMRLQIRFDDDFDPLGKYRSDPLQRLMAERDELKFFGDKTN